LKDVQEWLGITQWSQEKLTTIETEKVQDTLFQLDLIEEKVAIDKLLYN